MGSIQRTFIRTVLCAGVSASAIAVSGAATAQSSSDSDDMLFEEVVVTGSRIKSSNVTAPSPLQIVNSDFIESQGTINIQEALQFNPSFGIPGQSRTTSNTDITSAGAATVNLRNLGANRTLVLVDGKRMIAGVPGTTQVDLAMVPTEFVERVEVLTGGASAAYGSDAVAGVVNLIYKRDFEGLVLNAQAGISEKGDDEQYKVSLTAGHNFADDRGNFMINMAWSDQGVLRSDGRERSSDDFTSLGRLNGNPAEVFESTVSRSGVVPAGILNAGGVNYVFNDAGTGVSVWGGSQEERFNRNDFNSSRAIASPVNRLTFAARVSFEVNEKLTAYTEANYGKVSSTSYFEPHPLVYTSDLLGPGHRLNLENYLLNPATGETQIVRNPYIPDVVYNNSSDNDGDGLLDATFNKRMVEFGNRRTEIERQTFRMVVGAEGDINDNWSYDVHYSYGRSEAAGRMAGLFNMPNFDAATNVASDIYDFDGDGDTTEAICVDQTQRALGCVPLNLYGVGNVSEEAADYVRGTGFRDSVQEMHVVSAQVSGSVFELPAGPLLVAAGVEYRRESSENLFDPLTNAKKNGYLQFRDTVGSHNVKEAFSEVNVPLLADAPAAKRLSLRAAARVSDYSTVGSFWAYDGGIEWEPIEDLRFRAVYAHAVRAPNIGELYAASSAGVTSISDPCNGVTASGGGDLADRCRAEPGVMENINANGGVFTLNQSDLQGVGTLSESNPDIAEETATTYTIGAVYSPSNIPGLVFTVDYFNIELEGAINRVETSTILNKCYAEGLDEFCDFVTRRASEATPYSAGSVEQIVRGLVNSGGTWAEGLDFTLNYGSSLAGIGLDGDATVSVSFTHLIDQGIIPLEGDAANNLAGEVGYATNKGFISLGYENGPFSATLTGTYIGSSYLDDVFIASTFGTDVDRDYFKVSSIFYTDLQLQYAFSENLEFYIGAKNLLNTDAPLIWGGLPGGSADTGTNTGVYDAIGRRFFSGVRVKF